MLNKVTFDINGMTCATCVRRVEEGLLQTPGVSKANVNFATQKAAIEYESDKLDIKALQNKVHDLGYEALIDTSGFNQEKITISVGGMTCAACVRRVENALNSVHGSARCQRQPGDRPCHNYSWTEMGWFGGT